jgi:UDP-2-acetamido-3-amino-2,3-dideoxy-glucuronate N-acetyltransferase
MIFKKLLRRSDKVSNNIDARAIIGLGTKVWENSQIREDAIIGKGCNIGRNVYVGPAVKIGNNVKIQNNALIYEPAIVADGVFIGPGVIFTNDLHPRAITNDGKSKTEEDWNKEGVVVEYGASIGAGAICVAPVKIGKWAMIAAGSVVTKDVLDFSLVAGVPAKQIGWVGKSGVKLIQKDQNLYVCPETQNEYKLSNGKLSEIN